jgi:hypothetical protein
LIWYSQLFLFTVPCICKAYHLKCASGLQKAFVKTYNTFSAEAPVNTNVENTGRGYLLFSGQHSIVAPIGKQNRGTDSGSENDS